MLGGLHERVSSEIVAKEGAKRTLAQQHSHLWGAKTDPH